MVIPQKNSVFSMHIPYSEFKFLTNILFFHKNRQEDSYIIIKIAKKSSGRHFLTAAAQVPKIL